VDVDVGQEIDLHPDNMDRDEVFSLSRSWNPLIPILKEQKKVLPKDK